MNGNTNIFEDEKKRFNALDALIVLIAILLVLVVVFRTQIVSFFSNTSTKMECDIYFTCEEIPNELTSAVADGASVTWVDADVKLGRLTRTSDFTESVKYEKNGDTLYLTTNSSYKSFTGKINGIAIKSNGCYIEGTDFISAGMTVTLTTGLVQFKALITDVVFIEQ